MGASSGQSLALHPAMSPVDHHLQRLQQQRMAHAKLPAEP